MPSRLLALPFIIAALVFLYLSWEMDEGYSIYIIPCVLVLAVIYVLSPQLNWWWYKRRPPELEGPLRMLLNKQHPFYRQLPETERRRFRDRVALYMLAREFMPQAMKDVPEDIKGVVAINAVQLTFGHDDFLLEPFERIVIYPKPFPSPQFPEQFHASEIYEEDGVVLFSAEQLMQSFLHPQQFYNIGLHEFAKVYLHLHPDAGWPDLGEESWDKLEAVSGFSFDILSHWINLPGEAIPPQAVMISHFFVFPRRFRQILPEAYDRLVEILAQDPQDK
jgi:Mlc titration factor MtfA (ptsG expression regulator)